MTIIMCYAKCFLTILVMSPLGNYLIGGRVHWNREELLDVYQCVILTFVSYNDIMLAYLKISIQNWRTFNYKSVKIIHSSISVINT